MANAHITMNSGEIMADLLISQRLKKHNARQEIPCCSQAKPINPDFGKTAMLWWQSKKPVWSGLSITTGYQSTKFGTKNIQTLVFIITQSRFIPQ